MNWFFRQLLRSGLRSRFVEARTDAGIFCFAWRALTTKPVIIRRRVDTADLTNAYLLFLEFRKEGLSFFQESLLGCLGCFHFDELTLQFFYLLGKDRPTFPLLFLAVFHFPASPYSPADLGSNLFILAPELAQLLFYRCASSFLLKTKTNEEKTSTRFTSFSTFKTSHPRRENMPNQAVRTSMLWQRVYETSACLCCADVYTSRLDHAKHMHFYTHSCTYIHIYFFTHLYTYNIWTCIGERMRSTMLVCSSELSVYAYTSV